MGWTMKNSESGGLKREVITVRTRLKELMCLLSSKNIQCLVCSKNLINKFILLLFTNELIYHFAVYAKCYVTYYIYSL